MAALRIAVVGVGPVGGIFAAHLAQAGHEVVLVDPLQSHMEEIRRRGLAIVGTRDMLVPFPSERLCHGVEGLHEHDLDYVFVAVKASLLRMVLPQIAHFSGAQTTIVAVQNGLDNEDAVAEVFGAHRTLRMVVHFAGNLIGHGRIRMSFFHPPNFLGAIHAQAAPKAALLAEAISAAGLQTSHSADIKRHAWEKTIVNAALNPVCALTRRSMRQMVELEETRSLAEEILVEAIAVAEANGVHLEDGFLEHCIRYLECAGHHRTSMHIDLAKGQPTEIGFINGKIVAYGAAKGVATPVNRTIVALIRGAELPEHLGE